VNLNLFFCLKRRVVHARVVHVCVEALVESVLEYIRLERREARS
jgi:hypothetical protein